MPNFLKPRGIMKKYFYLLFIVFAVSSCHDDGYEDTNFIPNIVFSTTINLNLPQNQNLLIPNQYVVYPNMGHRGVIVYNMGNGEQSVDEFVAFDLACPHIELTSCANPMDISNFPEMTNACDSDGIFYDFQLGYSRTYEKDAEGNQISVSGVRYDLQQYKAERLGGGNELRISNF